MRHQRVSRVGGVSRVGRVGSRALQTLQTLRTQLTLTLLTLLTLLLPGVLHAQAARRSMGLTMQGQGSRIFITQVDDGGPADRAGLKAGDEIQSIAGISVARLDPKVLRVIVDTAKVMKFVIWRNEKKLVFNVQPGMYAPPRPRPRPQTQPLDEPRAGRRQI